jgi:hypothetical protein
VQSNATSFLQGDTITLVARDWVYAAYPLKYVFYVECPLLGYDVILVEETFSPIVDVIVPFAGRASNDHQLRFTVRVYTRLGGYSYAQTWLQVKPGVAGNGFEAAIVANLLNTASIGLHYRAMYAHALSLLALDSLGITAQVTDAHRVAVSTTLRSLYDANPITETSLDSLVAGIRLSAGDVKREPNFAVWSELVHLTREIIAEVEENPAAQLLTSFSFSGLDTSADLLIALEHLIVEARALGTQVSAQNYTDIQEAVQSLISIELEWLSAGEGFATIFGNKIRLYMDDMATIGPVKYDALGVEVSIEPDRNEVAAIFWGNDTFPVPASIASSIYSPAISVNSGLGTKGFNVTFTNVTVEPIACGFYDPELGSFDATICTLETLASSSYKCICPSTVTIVVGRRRGIAAAGTPYFTTALLLMPPPTTMPSSSPTTDGNLGGLSPGGIAGLVIGILAFLILLGLLAFFLIRRRNKNRGSGSTAPVNTSAASIGAKGATKPAAVPAAVEQTSSDDSDSEEADESDDDDDEGESDDEESEEEEDEDSTGASEQSEESSESGGESVDQSDDESDEASADSNESDEDSS